MLSIDKNGYCIFHSEDIEWKRRNNFGYWMQILFKFLSLIDKGAIDYEHNGWKGFDLRGIGWLASYGEGEEPVILFDRLNFLSDMYLFFQGGIFYDSVRIRNCKPPETEMDFSLCNYLFSLVEDITQARHSVFVSVMKTGLKKRSQLGTALKESIQQGVQVVVFVKNKITEAEWLQREGVTVRVSEHLTFQLVMIDKKDLVWQHQLYGLCHGRRLCGKVF